MPKLSSPTTVHVSLMQALAAGPPPAGNLAVPIFSRGSVVVEMYSPVGADPQKPHTRDELYFVTRGSGKFFDGQKRHSVASGSFIFVAAGQVHRFEDFSDDFVVWVVFYGPEGGEARP
jgi:mannose-6-phosphate isomerase-like protein (cupin superfamily)